MTKRIIIVSASIACTTLAGLTLAGIPERPVILHGPLLIDGLPVRGDEDVTILARVDGVAEPVGSYRMGGNTAAEDNYVLRIRLESPADGAPQSDNAAVIGQTANIFVKIADGPERPAGQFEITESGAIVLSEVSISTQFGRCVDTPPAIDLLDYAEVAGCVSGVGIPVGPDCECSDFEGDGDSDLRDFARFQRVFGSP